MAAKVDVIALGVVLTRVSDGKNEDRPEPTKRAGPVEVAPGAPAKHMAPPSRSNVPYQHADMNRNASPPDASAVPGNVVRELPIHGA